MRRMLLLAASATFAAAFVGVGVARADTALTVGSGWQGFSWVGQTQPVVPTQTPFTFTTTLPVVLKITDVLCPGEVFTVYDNAVLVGQTSAPGLTTCDYANSTGDPTTALSDPNYSGGVAALKAGTHSITIIVTTAPYPEGGGYIRIDAVGPTAYVSAQGGGARYLQVKKFH